MEEITAYHESGHAILGIALGGTLRGLTIAPEQDDDLPKYGEVQIEWPNHSPMRNLMVVLAGPAAEMVYTGEHNHPLFVPEWKHDWQAAWQAAKALVKTEQAQMRLIESMAVRLIEFFDIQANWSSVAAVADHLLAYEHLEDDTVRELLEVFPLYTDELLANL